MVSELQVPNESQSWEISVPEFGSVDSRYFEQSGNYHGRLYRMHPDVQKSVAELIGFAANFDLPAIKTAFLDVVGAAGHIVMEIARNTKPTDISVRYSRERWSVHDVVSKKAAEGGPSPWVKTEYHAKRLDANILEGIAEQLKVPMEELSKFVIRFNFKEKTFGLIAHDQLADAFPSGAYTWFAVPLPSQEDAQSEPDDTVSADAEGAESGADAQGVNSMESNTASIDNVSVNEEQAQTSAEVTSTTPDATPAEEPTQAVTTETVSQPAGETVAQATPELAAQATPELAAQATPELAAQAAPVSAAPATPSSSSVVEAIAKTIDAASAEVKSVAQAVAAPKPEAKPAPKGDDFFTKQQPQAQKKPAAPQQQPRQEQYSAPVNNASNNAPRRYDADNMGQAKYATYSRSEIDHMLKQQAEQILAALSGKVASQQRAFQEAIASQEKAFNKIADNFVSQFDAARIKLEGTTKTAQESTHQELEAFQKQFSKELDQHRTQINKVVAPVSKALEDPSKFKQQQPKESKADNLPKAASKEALAALQKQNQILMGMLGVVIVLLIVNLLCVLNPKPSTTDSAATTTDTTTSTSSGK